MKANFDVLISYSSRDRHIANEVIAALEAKGITCWIDHRDIEPGQVYSAAIMEAIERCYVFLLFLTNASNDSKQVQREVENADRLSRLMVPFIIDDLVMAKSLQYYLNSVQWILSSKPSYKPSLQSLTNAVQKRLNRKIENSFSLNNSYTSQSAIDLLMIGKEAYLRLAYEEATESLFAASELGLGQADFLLGRMFETGGFF